jgi:hypothetical protein
MRNSWGVKTYAIGFNLEGGENQLNAIAMNGGTGLSQYIPATDVSSLTQALADILAAIDPRNCTGEDMILPPACTDNDSDGWCSFLDCYDNNASRNPGATEILGNSIDDDCDGFTDEPADGNFDFDGDGITINQGDCNDFQPLVGPKAIEVAGDGVDNDCDGSTDEALTCPCGTSTGTSLPIMNCATEISCHPIFVNSQSMSSPTGDNISTAWTAVTRFGSATNHLAPRAYSSYGLIATGPATGTSHSTDLPGGTSIADPYDSSGYLTYDNIEYTVNLTAPQNAQGFSFDYVFFSEEYDEYVGTAFNDKFYAFLTAPVTTGGVKRIINFTNCRGTYYDFVDPQCTNNHCCYIAINTALSECCWYNNCPQGYWTTNIGGTGYSCGTYAQDSPYPGGAAYGSSTGWLVTTWNIQPRETFTLRFHLHDTSDGIYDSEIILDNFKWHTTAVTPGTEPID